MAPTASEVARGSYFSAQLVHDGHFLGFDADTLRAFGDWRGNDSLILVENATAETHGADEFSQHVETRVRLKTNGRYWASNNCSAYAEAHRPLQRLQLDVEPEGDLFLVQSPREACVTRCAGCAEQPCAVGVAVPRRR